MVRNPVEGSLEQGGIKLTAVASDVFGMSGWAMLERIAKGETDVEALGKETRGALRKKQMQLKEALAGRWEPLLGLGMKLSSRSPERHRSASLWASRKSSRRSRLQPV